MTVRPQPEELLETGHRVTLAAVADVLLPSWKGLPSASDIELSGKPVDRVLSYAPELAPRLAASLSAVGDREIPHALREMLENDRKGLDLLLLVCCAAYYMQPSVQERTGYRGQEAEVIDRAELPAYLEDGTLERTVAPPNVAREFATLEEAGL
ncbi:hypothetical protein [Pararhizobium arenae]|uniref:hypothetical protein n=1 Tax=Pararhizobium arenae TaxID=1856850 RepID=UPI00094B346A|nr:hypothetical protein [Pararhizobium arenae]